MKILCVFDFYGTIGGAEIVFKNVCEGLVNKGHEVTVISTKTPDKKSEEIINGVNVIRTKVPNFMNRYFFAFLSIPEVLRQAKQHDIILTSTFTSFFPSWLSSIIKKKSVVGITHEVWIGKWYEINSYQKSKLSCLLHNLFEKMLYEMLLSHYIPVSNATKKDLIDNAGIPEDRITVIHNGIDYEHWNPKNYNKDVRTELGLSEDTFVYLFYGRPGPSKGVSYLIRAVNDVKKLTPDSKLVLILSNDVTYQKEREKLLQLIKDENIEDDVMVLDSKPYKELPNYVKMADCVVIPSTSEGFGFSACEAVAMGVPVVVSDVASLPEVVSGKHILVPPRVPKLIAASVVSISRGRWDYTSEKKFTWEDAINKYDEVLNKYKKL